MNICNCVAATQRLEGPHCITRPACCRLADKVDGVSTRTQGVEDRLAQALRSEAARAASCSDAGAARASFSARACLRQPPSTAAHPQSEASADSGGSGWCHDSDADPVEQPLSAGETAALFALANSSERTQLLSGLAATPALRSGGLPSGCYGPIASNSSSLYLAADTYLPAKETGGRLYGKGVHTICSALASNANSRGTITAAGPMCESADLHMGDEGRSRSISSDTPSGTIPAAVEMDETQVVVEPVQLDQFFEDEPRLWKVRSWKCLCFRVISRLNVE